MRRKILDAAMALFREGGADAVTMRAVASRIDYSPATIYLYFKGKEAILGELRDMGYGILVGRLREIWDHDPPAERLRRLGRDYLRFARCNPRLYELMFLTEKSGPCPADAVNCERERFSEFCAFVQSSLSAPARGRLQVEVAALGVWAVCHGLAMLIVREEKLEFLPAEGRAEAIDEALDFILERINS